MTYGIRILVRCPGCGRSLMDSRRTVDDLEAIHFLVKIRDRIGHLYLSQVYGSYNKVFEGVEDVPKAVVECSCPHCHAPFPFHGICPDCQAPIIGLDLQVGGVIKVCSRNGCKRHALEFENADDAFNLFKSQEGPGVF